MAQRRAVPLTHKATSLSDAIDGTNAHPGAMASLQNLIPDPTQKDTWICRPGAVDLSTFPGFSTAGFVSGLLVIGDILYGMIASNLHPGKDQPFAYDLANNAFLTVSGITAANVPTSPPTTGEWTPPILCQVGSRILVCHPGFPGSTIKFGWFDISGFSLSTVGTFSTAVTFTGDTDTADPAGTAYIEGQPYIFQGSQAVFPNNGSPVPVLLGTAVTGTNIPASTTIAAIPGLVKRTFIGDTTAASTTIANLKDATSGAASTSGLYVGQTVNGDGVPTGATISSINRGAFSMVISAAATKTLPGNTLGSVGTRLLLSKNVTGTADGTTFTTSNANTITGNPTILGVQPGMSVTGSGVSVGATALSTMAIAATIFGTAMAGSTDLVTQLQTSALSVGMAVTGLGVQLGTTIAALQPNAVILSLPMLSTGAVQLFFTGATITILGTLTGPASNVALTITGGTTTAPQWASGDTNINNLPSVPLGVAQMNGRAYFVVGTDGIAFSDSLIPCQISNATQVQALKPGDGLPCTSIAPLGLASPIAGGSVQALIVFQRDTAMQQITGDQATSNLALNALSVATGTRAPLSLAPCSLGLFFASPDGMRLIDFAGHVSPPFGQEGDGIVNPFLNVLYPSRICAAANGITLRVTVNSVFGAGDPPALVTSEYWYNLTLKRWSGPHTNPASLIQSWTNNFVLSSFARSGVIQLSDDRQTSGSVYTENGQVLNWVYTTVLLPDNQQVAMNCVTEGNLDLTSGRGIVTVRCIDDQGVTLDAIAIVATGGTFRQRPLPWELPLVFKQARFSASGASDASVRLGNLYLRVQQLGYANIPAIAIPYMLDDQGNIIDQDSNRIIAA